MVGLVAILLDIAVVQVTVGRRWLGTSHGEGGRLVTSSFHDATVNGQSSSVEGVSSGGKLTIIDKGESLVVRGLGVQGWTL